MNSQLQNLQPMLKESIAHFVTAYENGSSDFSVFESIFFRLIQSMLDPPLEVTWFYSAVTLHASKLTSENSPNARIQLAKDLFNLLISCSNLSSAPKRIALLAPLVYELYSILYTFPKKGFCLRMEIENLVEKIVGYVRISLRARVGGNGGFESDHSVGCLEDLVRVWTADQGGGSRGFGDKLREFFPGMSDGPLKEMYAKCRIPELAGVVLCEVFFLRLHLKFDSGECREELLKCTRSCAFQTITGFQNGHFLDVLFKMLSEPCLPVAALLSVEDAVVLQTVVYDAVILADYSYVYSDKWNQSADGYSRDLALLWSLVVHNATQFSRAICDQARAISYLNAFCESDMVSRFINWVSNQVDTEEHTSNIHNPKALIRWLLDLEKQGFSVFNHCISMLREKAIGLCTGDGEDSESSPDGLDLNQDRAENDLNNDQEMHDPGQDGFRAGITDTTDRKRRECSSDMGESQAKHAKYDDDQTGK